MAVMWGEVGWYGLVWFGLVWWKMMRWMMNEVADNSLLHCKVRQAVALSMMTIPPFLRQV